MVDGSKLTFSGIPQKNGFLFKPSRGSCPRVPRFFRGSDARFDFALFFCQMTRSNEEQLGSGMRIYIVLGLLNLYGYGDL